MTHAQLSSTCRRSILAAVAVVAAIVPVARCDAQARSERWMIGLGMQTPVPREWGVTAHLARAITTPNIPLRPSGLLLEAGVALRHLLQQPLMLEAVVRSYAGSGSNDRLTLGVRFARIF